MAALFERFLRKSPPSTNVISWKVRQSAGLKAGCLFLGYKRLSGKPEFAAVFHFQQFHFNLVTF